MPAVGIYDNPREQMQDKLAFDFMMDGNLFVYGMAGSGKTVFLQTLCLSLAHSLSPQEAGIYVLDFGGGAFKRWESLPHIGGVITVEEEHRLNQFMVFIFRMIEERKKVFLNASVDGFVQFKEKSAGEMPAVFILVDNYTALTEVYDSVAEQMLTLAREGVKYGIYIVATATQEKAYRFSANFKMAVAFEMNDKGDYDSIVGRSHGLTPAKNAGRALLRNNPPLEFQTANCCFKENSFEDVLKVYDYFVQAGKIKPAQAIPQMPEVINIFELNKQPLSAFINLGLLNDNLQPAGLDLNMNHLLLITGEPGSGKSTLLVSLAKVLLSLAKAKIYVKDSTANGLYPLLGMENVVNLDELSENDEFDLIDDIKAVLEERRAQLLECRKNGCSLAEFKDSWEYIVFILDDLLDFIDGGASGSVLNLLERIAKNEHGLKIAIWAGGNTSYLSSSYDSFVKVFKNSGCGVVFGSLKEQGVFNIRLPYGSYEKTDFKQGEGYLVTKNKYAGIKAAADISLL